jgi:uncharacterized iron-regulated membrane protein
MSVRLLFLYAHRWLGLSTAVVLAVAGLTGAVLVWPDDFSGRWTIRQLHESLKLGPAGHAVVLTAAAAAIVLQLSGLVLWWRRKIVWVRRRSGWQRIVFDLHHAAGVLCLPVMLVLAATAVGRPTVRALTTGETRSSMQAAITRFHTTNGFPSPIKALYMVGSAAFLVQGVTGVFIWWKR